MNEFEFSKKRQQQKQSRTYQRARGISGCVSRLGTLLRFCYLNAFGAGAIVAATGLQWINRNEKGGDWLMEWTIHFAAECTCSNPREKSRPWLLLEIWLVVRLICSWTSHNVNASLHQEIETNDCDWPTDHLTRCINQNLGAPSSYFLFFVSGLLLSWSLLLEDSEEELVIRWAYLLSLRWQYFANGGK